MNEAGQQEGAGLLALSSVVPLALFVVPLLAMVVLSFQGMQDFQLRWTWDLSTWSTVFERAHFWRTLWRTLLLAAISVALSALLAYPVACGLARRGGAWSARVQLVIVFVFLTDSVLKTYGWVLMLDREGVANFVIRALGVVGPEFDQGLLFTPVATVLGMVYSLLPFMIFTLYLALAGIDPDLVRAAQDAGASSWQAFRDVTLPLSLPGLAAGSLFVFVLGSGAMLEEKILGGGKDPVMGELIRQSFETRVHWPLGSALTIVLILADLAVVGMILGLLRVRRSAAS